VSPRHTSGKRKKKSTLWDGGGGRRRFENDLKKGQVRSAKERRRLLGRVSLGEEKKKRNSLLERAKKQQTKNVRGG